MKNVRLKGNKGIYACNSYLSPGTWNRIEDVNALIDAGSDGSIIASIVSVIDRPSLLGVEAIYSEHGESATSFDSDMILNTLKNVRRSAIREKEVLLRDNIS